MKAVCIGGPADGQLVGVVGGLTHNVRDSKNKWHAYKLQAVSFNGTPTIHLYVHEDMTPGVAVMQVFTYYTRRAANGNAS